MNGLQPTKVLKMSNINNVLITGGAGFIGSNLSLKLIKDGYNVTVLDNLSPQIHGADPSQSYLFNRIKDKVNFVRGSVSSREDWLVALEGQDAVIHLAAETGTGQSMYEVSEYTEVNILGTSILLDLLSKKKFSLKKMIVASSRAIYGEGKYSCEEHGIVYPVQRLSSDMESGDFNVKCPVCASNVNLLPTDEESKIHPTSLYGLTKQTQEEMVLLMGRALNIPAIALRYQNVYGPGQSLSNPYTGILSIFSTRLMNNNDINVYEDGNESRDFVYIDDVVTATVAALESRNANFQALNVGSGVRTSVLDLTDTLMNAFSSKSKAVVSGNFRIGDIRDNYADLNKVSDLLGFSPTTSFSDGIKKFVSWVTTQDIANDNYDKSVEEMKKNGLFK